MHADGENKYIFKILKTEHIWLAGYSEFYSRGSFYIAC